MEQDRKLTHRQQTRLDSHKAIFNSAELTDEQREFLQERISTPRKITLHRTPKQWQEILESAR